MADGIVGSVPYSHADGCRCHGCRQWGNGQDIEALRQRLYGETTRDTTTCRNCGDVSFDRTGVCWRPECIAAISEASDG